MDAKSFGPPAKATISFDHHFTTNLIAFHSLSTRREESKNLLVNGTPMHIVLVPMAPSYKAAQVFEYFFINDTFCAKIKLGLHE